MTVNTLFLLRAGLEPHMDTLHVSLQVAAESCPAAAVPLKDCSARLAGDAVVVALLSEVLTGVHVRSQLYHRLLAVN